MNRNEFMTKLELLLAGISREEREEALQYYTDYFEDAGAENETEVIRELGSPEKVAATIKADLKYDSDAEAGEFTENGYRDARFEEKSTPARRESTQKAQEDAAEGKGYTYAGSDYQRGYTGNEDSYGGGADSAERAGTPKSNTGLKILLIALIVLVGAPIVIPVGIGILITIGCLLFAAFAFFAGLVIGALAVMILGLVLVVAGIMLLTTAVPAAILTMGSGFLTFVAGLIGTVATAKLCMVMYPAMCRILVNICRKPFHKRKAVAGE